MSRTTDLQLENALGELTRCRGSLRNRLTSALDLAAHVVLEQRPPFCGAFLHVHRLLLPLSDEAQPYFEMEEASLPARSGLDAPYPAGGLFRRSSRTCARRRTVFTQFPRAMAAMRLWSIFCARFTRSWLSNFAWKSERFPPNLPRISPAFGQRDLKRAG